MVHLRLNAKSSNPNPFVNFISALPNHNDAQNYESALQLMNALAAQVKPIMKSHGFTVNSLEEYEYNQVFAGRNWNNGETIELVLRRADGSFQPVSYIMSTLCHELAHILHMNHGPDFQALWRQLRREVRLLQDKGYYGDGFWSSGTSLADSARIAGSGIEVGDMPEFLCGGAHRKQRAPRPRRRRAPRKPRATGPSLHTGRQTEKQRKPGTRVRSVYAFVGEGTALNADDVERQMSKKGTGFGKRTQSNRAREERAAAAERRLQQLTTPKTDPKPELDSHSDTESEDEYVPETDTQRRLNLQETLGADESLDKLKLGHGSSWLEFADEFKLPPTGTGDATSAGPSRLKREPKLKVETELDVIDIDSSETEDDDDPPMLSCDVVMNKGGSSASAGAPSASRRVDKGKRKAEDQDMLEQPSTKRPKPTASSSVASMIRAEPSRPSILSHQTKPKPGRKTFVKAEMETRTKEMIGLLPSKGRGAQMIGAAPHSKEEQQEKPLIDVMVDEGWSCRICTLINNPQHLACDACGIPRSPS